MNSEITGLKKKISMYFDNALDQSQCNELLNQVTNDPKVQSIYSKEKDFRDYIKSHIVRPAVSLDLVESIKKNIIR
jgi:F0F1-type ATP synthase delta subunit